VDLHDFDAPELYFERPLAHAAQALLETASAGYGENAAEAERCLLRAHLLEPRHLSVLVALYRFYYYQHRLGEALQVADRALDVSGTELGLHGDWRQLTVPAVAAAGARSMGLLRFHLLALKGSGLLCLRLGRRGEAVERLSAVTAFDPGDRLGARFLLLIAQGIERLPHAS
jgi:tetratricopeptide (TPR) repeat protein